MEERRVVILDRNLKLIAASPEALAALTGDGANPVGKGCRELFLCPDCPGELCPLRQARAGEAVEGFMASGRFNSTLLINATPLQNGDSIGVMAFLTVSDGEPEPVVLGLGLQRVLDALRGMLRSDLAALAFYDEGRKEARWQVTSGNLSADLTSIRLRPGQGFAGRIVMTELPLRTFRFPADLTDDPQSYPIFLAEGLKAAMGVPVRSEGRVLGVLMVASRTEREYLDEDLERLTHVADSISLAAEMMRLHEEALRRQRIRLAQEMHDGLSQNLFGLQLLMHDLQENLHDDPPEKVRAGLRNVTSVLDATLTEVRGLIRGLRGSMQVRGGLVAALTDYLTHFYRLSDLQVELAVGLEPGEEATCSGVAEVLRIVQEALMNIHRHASARRVRVEIAKVDGGYRLLIEDDGEGFDPAVPPGEGHYGLAIMHERAQRIGGRLAIDAARGRGTRVTLQFPL